MQLRRSHALGDFFRLIDRKPDAAALLQVYARENDVEMLRDFYYQDDRRRQTACLALEESLSQVVSRQTSPRLVESKGSDTRSLIPESNNSYPHQDFGDKVAKVRQAAKAFGEDKDCAFESKVRAGHALHSGITPAVYLYADNLIRALVRWSTIKSSCWHSSKRLNKRCSNLTLASLD